MAWRKANTRLGQGRGRGEHGVGSGELSCRDGTHGEGKRQRGSDRGGRGCRRPYTWPNGVRTAPPRPANGSTTCGDRAADRWVPRVSSFLILK
jgi:hypothetical protein